MPCSHPDFDQYAVVTLDSYSIAEIHLLSLFVYEQSTEIAGDQSTLRG